MGSEMCIRDSSNIAKPAAIHMTKKPDCLLYTSDAADEEDSVDLGGRRIIKKKNITIPLIIREVL